MKNYILSRIFKSIISIFAVVSICIIMLFTMIPREKALRDDDAYKKLAGDTRTTYLYSRYEDLGYLDFLRLNEMCESKGEDASCLVMNSEENLRVTEYYRSKGYTIDYLRNGEVYATKDKNILQLLWKYYSRLITIDTPNFVDAELAPADMNRGYSFGKGPNGAPAILCSGCQYKYQVYFNDSFPFIHQNFAKLNFGTSYPTNQGVPTTQIISDSQGAKKPFEQTFPTGAVENSPINQFSCKFKNTLDHIDQRRFNDHYADCLSINESPSMINTSYIFGICALIIAYLVALPSGISMARKKGKFQDKLGIAVINFLIAVPSLALIFFVRQVGTFFGMPDRFPILGFGSWKSYLVPMIILALLQMPSLMTWIRRYMIDQSNADYAKFAKAKGLSQKEIFRNHILKNAIIPIVNGIPSSIILCISGALITESAFAIPGMGKMLPDSIKKVNNNMVINLVFIFTALSVFAILIGDLLMTVVDPRIQLAAKGGK